MVARSKPSRRNAREQREQPASGRTALYGGLGVVSFILAAFLSLALLSFHPDDPSFNQTGTGVVHNLAGLFGAYLAETLLQLVGYASGWLIILFAVLGYQWLQYGSHYKDRGTGRRPPPSPPPFAWEKLAAMPMLMVVTAILSSFSLGHTPPLLPSGPGGILGMVAADAMRHAFGLYGSLFFLIPLAIAGAAVLAPFSLTTPWDRLHAWRARRQQAALEQAPVTTTAESPSTVGKKQTPHVETTQAAGSEVPPPRIVLPEESVKPPATSEMHSPPEPELDLLAMEPPATPEMRTPPEPESDLPTFAAARSGIASMRETSALLLARGMAGITTAAVSSWRLCSRVLNTVRAFVLPPPPPSPAWSTPLEETSEPDFFPLQEELYREPTLDDLPDDERSASFTFVEQEEPHQHGTLSTPSDIHSSPPSPPSPEATPTSPVLSAQESTTAEAAAMAHMVLSSPDTEQTTEQKTAPPQTEATETSSPATPLFLWPESQGCPADENTPALEPFLMENEIIPKATTPDEVRHETPASPGSTEQSVQNTEKTAQSAESIAHTAAQTPPQELPLPSLAILVDPGPQRQEGTSREELTRIARTLEQKLADFKIKGQIVDVLPGPVVTTFELDPAPGLRAAKVVGLADDLARSISASSVRVVGNVPGKTVIGIEIPNAVRQTVYLKEMLSSEIFRRIDSPLAVALGSDIFGHPVVGNLAKMPHLLVAGTTGSGKSVAVNAMICSILFSARPSEVRFLMVDPKMLELSIYEGIPHLLAPVVTDVHKAANLLKWAVGEMESRYRLMSELGVRSLAGYNTRIAHCIAHEEQPTRRVRVGFDPETGRPVEQEEPIPLEIKPLIVIVIDELADLMIQVGKEVEPAIARLAQMARAAGLHLILATQRPSVDVITGLIKANFPTRLAFQVSSKIDSRTILDAMGADRLLGMGDGLFLPPGTSHLQRIHAPFVSDKEVHDLVKYLKTTGTPDYDSAVLMQPAATDDEGSNEVGVGPPASEAHDELYDQAAGVVIRARKVSVSMVQRHFKIGYNRAARIVERMEQDGLVSEANAAGKREVLAPETGE